MLSFSLASAQATSVPNPPPSTHQPQSEIGVFPFSHHPGIVTPNNDQAGSNGPTRESWADMSEQELPSQNASQDQSRRPLQQASHSRTGLHKSQSFKNCSSFTRPTRRSILSGKQGSCEQRERAKEVCSGSIFTFVLALLVAKGGQSDCFAFAKG